MKKIYSKPLLVIVAVKSENIMGSTSGGRFVGGGVTDSDDPSVPTTVENTSENEDPFDSHGQVAGGTGVRSKGYDLWEDDLW